uniref:Uncharacterized protein n=1 Tax=Trypanosoma congolense (strain IL3000) TaxID=1068625 RepID=G0UTX3_TRYCI|nr:hypothetical protein, unlikely [Trypanosoma congolense IL3000]
MGAHRSLYRTPTPWRKTLTGHRAFCCLGCARYSLVVFLPTNTRLCLLTTHMCLYPPAVLCRDSKRPMTTEGYAGILLLLVSETTRYLGSRVFLSGLGKRPQVVSARPLYAKPPRKILGESLKVLIE